MGVQGSGYIRFGKVSGLIRLQAFGLKVTIVAHVLRTLNFLGLKATAAW